MGHTKTDIIIDNVWSVSNTVPTETCKYLISLYENQSTFRDCRLGGVVNKQSRDSQEVHIKEESIIQLVWDNIQPWIPSFYQGRKIAGHDGNTFYLLRYEAGQQFKHHRDGHSTNATGQKSFVTALIYLNNDYSGGHTRFYAEPQLGLNLNGGTGQDNTGMYYEPQPEPGLLVLMRHYILHCSMPIEQGVKYALRFNILYENFAPWYSDSRPGQTLAPIGEKKAWSLSDSKHYYFLPHKTAVKTTRLPVQGEDYCNNCFEILDLRYDYYNCPGCMAPVIYTRRQSQQIINK